MSDEILLSICIPTYNRGEILIKTIEAYINDPAFNEQVEIVISDNCSTDHTEELITKYLNRFRNIKYKRMSENIGAELNMSTVMTMGSGLYLKLMNDTVTMKPGILKYMLNILDLSKNQSNPTFFYQNIPFSRSNQTVFCSDMNELVSSVSFWITWISNFGIWQKDFKSLENKNRLAHLQFPQSDWTIRLINGNKNNIIYFGDYYNIANLTTKGGYNVFQTFGVNYLSLYADYIKSGLMNVKVYNKEKYRLFRFNLLNLYFRLVLLKDEKLFFEKGNAFKIMFINYRYKPYFYLGLIYLRLRLILEKLKRNLNFAII